MKPSPENKGQSLIALAPPYLNILKLYSYLHENTSNRYYEHWPVQETITVNSEEQINLINLHYTEIYRYVYDSKLLISNIDRLSQSTDAPQARMSYKIYIIYMLGSKTENAE
jgi:hypothetical protein